MYFPLKTPNIPRSKVTVVAVSESADEALFQKLDELGIEAIKTQRSNNVKDINYHSDLFLLNISQGNLFIEESQRDSFVKYLTIGYKLKEISSIRSPYPLDCGLNCVVMGDKIICNRKTVHADVSDFAHNNGYGLIDVKQGYTKCSVCVVNDNALITDDESIYNACQNNLIDSILISKGSIRLKGFDYGFIGGCTGLIDKNNMLFNGDLNCHTDCNKIIDFLGKYSVKPIIIENRPLEDIGSIIPLCEKHRILSNFY